MADQPSEGNYFAEELRYHYEAQGKSLSRNICEVLGKSYNGLSDDERKTYENFILPSLGGIKDALLERLKSQISQIDTWKSKLPICSESIIGGIAAEVIDEVSSSIPSGTQQAQMEEEEKEEYASCPKCDEQIKATAKFCENCGYSLAVADSQRCSNCGVIVTAGKSFCEACGVQLSPAAGVASHTPTHVPQIVPPPYTHTYAAKGRFKSLSKQSKIAIAILSSAIALAIVVVIIFSAIDNNKGASTSNNSGSSSSSTQQSNDRSNEALSAAKADTTWSVVKSLSSAYGTPNITVGIRSGFTDNSFVCVEGE